VRDRKTHTVERVAVGRRGGSQASISADGRFVAFSSNADNLVPHDTNPWHDVFVHNRQTRTTRLVSISSSGDQANGDSFQPSISADGRFVAFSTEATNLMPHDTNGEPDVLVRDRQRHTTRPVSVDSSGNRANGISGGPSVSADGRFVAFDSNASDLVPHDTNNTDDVFVHKF
jgi:Tol biopolymer transport system component